MLQPWAFWSDNRWCHVRTSRGQRTGIQLHRTDRIKASFKIPLECSFLQALFTSHSECWLVILLVQRFAHLIEHMVLLQGIRSRSGSVSFLLWCSYLHHSAGNEEARPCERCEGCHEQHAAVAAAAALCRVVATLPRSASICVHCWIAVSMIHMVEERLWVP